MHKIGVLGDFENTAYFSIMGAEVFFPKNGEEAAEIVKKLASGGYAAVFVSEKYFEYVVAENYTGADSPAIVPLPLAGESLGTGINRMKMYTRSAAGADISF